MKINIAGKGMIPGMGTLPPVFNVEKSENDIRRLVNFNNIRIYCSENGLLINKKNVDTFFKVPDDNKETEHHEIDIEFKSQPVQSEHIEEIVENVIEKTKTNHVEKKHKEKVKEVEAELTIVDEEIVDDVKEEESIKEEPVLDEVEDCDVVEEKVEETEDEPKPFYSNKSKRRNKNKK